MSESASESTSGNVNFGDTSPKWVTFAIIGVVILAVVWFFKRK